MSLAPTPSWNNLLLPTLGLRFLRLAMKDQVTLL